MRKLLIFFGLLAAYAGYAQEVLSPIRSNPRLYYSSPKKQREATSSHDRHKLAAIVQGGDLLIESDTLPIPFIDDFSYNTLKPFHYDQYIYDTIYRAYGPCDTFMHTTLDTARGSIVPTYAYTFDITQRQLDSTLTTPTYYHYFPNLTRDCFDHLADSIALYPLWYHYSFDSATGRAFNPVLDANAQDTAILYTPIIYKSRMPAFPKWIDNYANHNYTYAYLPPSIGVATLDGLNEFGRPYDNSSSTSYGQADYLTSKPIDLGGLTDADSVYLSFFYEARGFGDFPNTTDSLCLEFYNGYTSKWDHIWSTPGFANQPGAVDTFHQVILRLPSTVLPDIEYLYKGFQFRFTNYATLAGNNDHWHIDYVRLAKNRSITDTSVSDVAFQYEIPSVLKHFSEMPAWQFRDSIDIADSLRLYVANLNQDQAQNNPPATSYSVIANELYPTPQQVYFATSSFNATTENTVSLFPSTDYAPIANSPDSLVIKTRANINVPNYLLANDTVSNTQTLTNTYAYDDGTAEQAYGLRNLGVKKFGYEFLLNQPDTIVGFQVLFTNIDVDVHDLVFYYNIWDTIKLNDPYYMDSAVYQGNNTVPLYVDSVNGFATYKIDPFPVPTRFYFGWSQTDTRDIQIGFDRNSTKGFEHMYVYTSGVWQHTGIQVQGSPMIRLLMRHSNQVATGIKPAVTNSVIKAYPNPTSGTVQFDLPDAQYTYVVELYNSMGQLAYKQTLDQTNTIDIHALGTGVYLLRLIDSKSGISYQNKIIKTAN